MPYSFSPYQRFVLALLAFLQFTVVLDFMILSPLGAQLLDELHVGTQAFGLVVSAYAFSAGASGLLTSGFADRFDRKQLLLFFYGGFLLGTLGCGLAPGYRSLLVARVVAGLFGGVIGSITMAIGADLFPLEVRGRVMGTIQTAFAASQVLGIPLGLFLANHWGWHAPFLLITALGALVGVVIATRLKPIDAHLAAGQRRNAVAHLLATVTKRDYLRGFSATALLATGGFMLMPFGSPFAVNNLGIPLERLPLLYMSTGVVSIVAGPLLGRFSDRVGKYRMFVAATLAGMALVVLYCNLGVTPFLVVVALNMALFVTISARMITSSALNSAVPEPHDRGAYMSINASIQQLSGGLASALAGMIVVQTPKGRLERYDVLGYVVAGAMTITVALMYSVHKLVQSRVVTSATAPPPSARAATS